MILRVPDYYEQFSCIAGECKDSCCIGWEIDIDEDTYQYYRNSSGKLAARFRKYMYDTKDREHSFQLVEHGRCPFLNAQNLCDICIEMGEEALSEVCTEYPRFTLEYDAKEHGLVVQKCMSLSCEEVGRILFTREEPVRFISHTMEMEDVDNYIEDDEDVDYEWIQQMEDVMFQAFTLLQNRKLSIQERMKSFLKLMEKVQIGGNDSSKSVSYAHIDSYDDFCRRFQIFEQMETLDQEWILQKKDLSEYFTQENYGKILSNYIENEAYCENDYEQLMVYFVYRYFMNAAYDYEPLTYAKMAVLFVKMIRDMDALRFMQNKGKYTREDRIDVVRIFSKEVEHSQENVAYAKEMIKGVTCL